MKIKTIGWGRTIPDGNFGNYKVYFEAEVEEGETKGEAEVLARLKTLVLESFQSEQYIQREYRANAEMISKLRDDINALEARLVNAKEAWKAAKTAWDYLVGLAEKQGFKVATTFPSDPWLNDKSGLSDNVVTDVETFLSQEEEVDDVQF